MRDLKDVGYDELVTLRGRCSAKLQQIYLRTWMYSIKHAPWSIGNQREKLLDRCPSIRHANVKLYQPRLLHCQCVESCYIAAAATYIPAGLVLLSPTPLLFKHAYWLSAAARWMLAGLWQLNQHACWPFVTQYCMSASGVLLYLLYLLVWSLTISHSCWYGVSLSTVSAGVVLHYSSCLLVWYLTISRASWFRASL